MRKTMPVSKKIVRDDNPPLTTDEWKKMRKAVDVVPHIVAAYNRSRGRPPVGDAPKVAVSLRVDPTVLAVFKTTGTGWQTRMNDALAKAALKIKSKAQR